MATLRIVFKKIFVKVLRYSGLPLLFREIIQRRKVTIVFFHDPKPEIASRNFRWLANHYNIIGLNQYLSAREKGTTRQLPPKAMVITMDDGHIENYKLLAFLRENNIPVTIFLCSGIVDTNRHYWFKYAGLNSNSDTLKAIPNYKRLKLLSDLGFDPEREFEYPQALNKYQIGEMRQYVNFQSHTVFHPCLNRCSEEESRFEIEESKRRLEQDFGLTINAFAFPNGDYSAKDIRLLQNAGYSCALKGGPGFNTDKTDLFRLKRIAIGDRDSLDLLAVKASGIWGLLKHFIRRLSSGK